VATWGRRGAGALSPAWGPWGGEQALSCVDPWGGREEGYRSAQTCAGPLGRGAGSQLCSALGQEGSRGPAARWEKMPTSAHPSLCVAPCGAPWGGRVRVGVRVRVRVRVRVQGPGAQPCVERGEPPAVRVRFRVRVRVRAQTPLRLGAGVAWGARRLGAGGA